MTQLSAQRRQPSHFVRSRAAFSTSSSVPIFFVGAARVMAPRGQAFLQASAQISMPMHFRSRKPSSKPKPWLSGLWHQRQRRGQPFTYTVVRMPGPSCTA